MTDTTQIDKTLSVVKKIGVGIGIFFYLMSIMGFLGTAWGVFVVIVTGLALLVLATITCFWWFGGLSAYNQAKRILGGDMREYSYRRDEYTKKANYNIELFARYMKVYPILWDCINFKLKKYETIYER